MRFVRVLHLLPSVVVGGEGIRSVRHRLQPGTLHDSQAKCTPRCRIPSSRPGLTLCTFCRFCGVSILPRGHCVHCADPWSAAKYPTGQSGQCSMVVFPQGRLRHTHPHKRKSLYCTKCTRHVPGFITATVIPTCADGERGTVRGQGDRTTKLIPVSFAVNTPTSGSHLSP